MSLWAKIVCAGFAGTILLLVSEEAERMSPTRSTCGFICIGPPSLTHVLLPLGYYAAILSLFLALGLLVREGATLPRVAVSLAPAAAAVLLVWLHWPPLTATRYGSSGDDFPQRPMPFLPLELAPVPAETGPAIARERERSASPVRAEDMPRHVALVAETFEQRLGMPFRIWGQDATAVRLVSPRDAVPAIEVVVSVPSEGARTERSAIPCATQDSDRVKHHELLYVAVTIAGDWACATPLDAEWAQATFLAQLHAERRLTA